MSQGINYDIPTNLRNYIHKIDGRGQFGRKGVVITMVTAITHTAHMEIQRFYSIQIEELPTNVTEVL